jgi:hypothetical protein
MFMDLKDEDIFITLLEEEADATASATNDNHMKIPSFLLGIYTRDLKLWRVCSRLGQRKSKPKKRLEGY